MSKRPKIKWRKSDIKKVSSTVRRFNAKITRTLKKHPDWAPFLPERLNVGELRKGIYSRQDFNRELKSAERFLRKGAEMPIMSQGGARTTAWAKREAIISTQTVNRKRARERKLADPSQFKAGMGVIKANNLLPKKFRFDKMSQRAWEMYVKTVNAQIHSNYNQSIIDKYKENYLKNIDIHLSGAMNTEILKDLIKDIPAETMYNAYYDDPVLQIGFTSDPLQADQIVNSAISHWSKYLGIPEPEDMVEVYEEPDEWDFDLPDY